MSGYEFRNKCVFSFRLNTVNGEAAVMTYGRLTVNCGCSFARERSEYPKKISLSVTLTDAGGDAAPSSHSWICPCAAYSR